MITVNICHYNRPYLLELNVLLLRHFLGDSIRIVVADDGSFHEVTAKIRKLPIDDLFINGGHGPGSFGKTMRKSMQLCKTEHYMFCEDDFIYLHSPIDAEHNVVSPLAGEFVPPGIGVGTDTASVLEAADEILALDPSVGMIKLQTARKISKRIRKKFGIVGGREKRVIENFVFWEYPPVSNICNSWPYIIRQEVANAMQCDKYTQMSVWKRQNFIKVQLVSRLAGTKVLAVIPGRVLHVGNGISVNVTGVNTDRVRGIRSTGLQSSLGMKSMRYDKFANQLAIGHCDGHFSIELEDVLGLGVNEAFKLAFSRLEKNRG